MSRPLVGDHPLHWSCRRRHGERGASGHGAGRDQVAGFYRGKTMRILIGYGPDGGRDIYSRLVAPFLPKPRRASRLLSPESRRFLLSVLNAGGHRDHLVTLESEGDRTDLRSVTRVARPACRVALPGLNVEVVASRQDGLVLAIMALLRTDLGNLCTTTRQACIQ